MRGRARAVGSFLGASPGERVVDEKVPSKAQERSARLLEALRVGPADSEELGARTGLTRDAVNHGVHGLLRGGRVRVVGARVVVGAVGRGSHRRRLVYGLREGGDAG